MTYETEAGSDDSQLLHRSWLCPPPALTNTDAWIRVGDLGDVPDGLAAPASVDPFDCDRKVVALSFRAFVPLKGQRSGQLIEFWELSEVLP